MSSKITIFIFAFPTFQDVELFSPAPSDYTIFGVFFRDSPLGPQRRPDPQTVTWHQLGCARFGSIKLFKIKQFGTISHLYLGVLQKCSRIWMKLSSFGIYHILFNHTKNQQILRIYFVLNDSRLGIVMKSNSSPHLVQNWSIRWFSWKIPLLGSTQIWLALVGTNRPVSLLESCSLATKTFSQIRLVRSKLWKVF